MDSQQETRRAVLIIDDDPDFADSLSDLLETRDYAVYSTESLEGAVAILRAPPDAGQPPAVALVDVRLGGLASGVDLIPRLRAELPDLICVLMTAALDSETAIKALRRGAYDYFDKSRDPAALFAVLDRCFDLVELQLERAAAYEALRLAKEEAEAASRGKSAFLATMSHELRTPLNAIIGFSEMMKGEVFGGLGNEQYRTYVSDIYESGSHLLQIINDILDLSKAEAGKLELFEDEFDLPEAIRAVRQLTGPRLQTAGLTERVALPPDLPGLCADERKTKQVLLNLVTNAIKFTPPGGYIDVSAQFDPEKGMTVTVTDTGIGIPEGDLDRVLQPFEQVDSSLSRMNHGTGLGLPLVKAIMELHGGELEIRSKVGAGTQVSITFPPSRVLWQAPSERSRSAA